jgi:putative glutamine amidotransferase
MTQRPVIGIAMQTQQPVAGRTPLCWIMGQRYIRALTAVGAVPWLIPLVWEDEATVRAIYEQLDGVFLTGGIDVDPQNYLEERLPELVKDVDPPRDRVEMLLVKWAVQDRKPVLGVCRGVQVINVALGGSLYQDVREQVVPSIKHDYFPTADLYSRDMLAHEVRIEQDTRLGRILGIEKCHVNSMHHQCVKRIAEKLRANAWAPDGVIEGLEGSNGQFLLGVQWHPEELTDKVPPMQSLFTTFGEAAAEFKARTGSPSVCPAPEPQAA